MVNQYSLVPLTERIISVGKTLFKRVVSGPNSSPIRVKADDASEATAGGPYKD